MRISDWSSDVCSSDLVDEGPYVGLHRVLVLRQERLLDLGDQTRVCEVDALDLELGRLLVEQVVQLLLRELADRLVGVEEAAAPEGAPVPAVHALAGDAERSLVERLGVVVELRQVEVGDRAHALAARAHAAGDREAALLTLLLAALLDGDGARPADRGHVERERLRRSDVGLTQPAEEDAQHRVGVGDRAHRRAGVGAHALLRSEEHTSELQSLMRFSYAAICMNDTNG